MFEKVLVATRGEIAVRIIRACEESDIETVLVVSEADENSLPARLADKVVCIGPPQVSMSYLNIPMIIALQQPTKVVVTTQEDGSITTFTSGLSQINIASPDGLFPADWLVV